MAIFVVDLAQRCHFLAVAVIKLTAAHMHSLVPLYVLNINDLSMAAHHSFIDLIADGTSIYICMVGTDIYNLKI